VIGIPNTPSGRSLRESLARSTGELKPCTFVSIPEDVVLCLELEGVDLSSAAADLVPDQPWLAELAAKLVTRKDVTWVDMAPSD
jgi:hypothetical protein